MFLGLEVIDFQSNIVLKEISFCIRRLREVKKSDIPKHPIVDELYKCVLSHFKVKINFNFNDEDMGPCIFLPDILNNHITNQDWVRGISENEILKTLVEKKNIKGSVNLRTGIVAGIFCNYTSKLYFPITILLNKKFIDEELAAIILHEIGNLFIYFELMSRTVTTNQLLASISRDIKGCNSAEEREVVFHRAKTKYNLKGLDEKELSKTTNKKVIETVIVTNIAKEMRSDLGGNIYDIGTAESMADQFACRFGAAVHLATGLEKLYREYKHIDFRTPFEFFSIEILKTISAFIPIVGHLIFVIAIAHDSSEEPRYDKPGTRIRKLREQLVIKSKNKKINKEELQSILTDISIIDNILKNIYDNTQFNNAIINVIISRKFTSQKEFQRKLEEIAINDIFLKSAELRTLGVK